MKYWGRVLDYVSLLNFDCASCRRSARFASIGQITEVRVVRNGQRRRWCHWPFTTGTGHGRITQRNLHVIPATHNGLGLCNSVVQSKAAVGTVYDGPLARREPKMLT